MQAAHWLALGAVGLWATLATLGVALAHVPPFLLTGLALLVGSLIALPLSRFDRSIWRVPPRTLALGVYGLFLYHFLLFMALRLAPPVQANLVNYLWPLGIVVLAPLFLPGLRLRGLHLVAALTGFAGAALAIVDQTAAGLQPELPAAAAPTGVSVWGYLSALAAALVWSSFSLLCKRAELTGRGFPTAAIGLFGLVSGLLALLCHVWLETTPVLTQQDGLLIAATGLGPLGGAFFLWDAALKRGSAHSIGLLSFLTPLLSTTLLLVWRGSWPGPLLLAAALLIVGAAVVGTRTPAAST